MRSSALVVAFLLGAIGSAYAGAPPQSDFVLHCAGCHRFDASGSATVPALDDLDRVLAAPGGRAYLLRVPGVAQAPLSDARLAALLNWVVAEFNARPPRPAFSEAEVRRGRQAPLRDPVAARERVLAAMHGDVDRGE